MYLTPPRPRVLAHRGFSAAHHDTANIVDNTVVENTVRAFEAAAALGVTYIESDVRSTSDGVAVLLHDPEFESNRAGKTYRVIELTNSELDTVRLSNGDRIPTVREVLDRFPNMRFNLDVKDAAAIEPLIRALEESRASSRVLVTSFSSRRSRRVRARLEHTFGGASSGQAWLIAIALLTRQRWMLIRMSREVHAAQLPSTPVSRFVLSPGNIERLNRAQIEVHIWTLNTAEEITFWLDRGVAGIITDRADLAMRVIAELKPRVAELSDSPTPGLSDAGSGSGSTRGAVIAP